MKANLEKKSVVRYDDIKHSAFTAFQIHLFIFQQKQPYSNHARGLHLPKINKTQYNCIQNKKTIRKEKSPRDWPLITIIHHSSHSSHLISPHLSHIITSIITFIITSIIIINMSYHTIFITFNHLRSKLPKFPNSQTPKIPKLPKSSKSSNHQIKSNHSREKNKKRKGKLQNKQNKTDK